MYVKIKNRLDTIFEKKRLEKFFYGPFYPVYVALFVTLFFATSTQLIGLLAVSITASIVFLRFKDATPIIPLLFFVVLVFRDYSSMNNVLAYVFLAPAIISFFIKFFKYPVKDFKPGKLFFPLIIVCYALFLGGILSPLNNYVDGISVMVTIGPTMLVIYIFFSAYISPPENFDVKKYLLYLLIVLGLTATMHILIYRLNMDVFNEDSFDKWSLGWGNINCAATLLLLAIPSCWYLISQVKNVIPCFIVLAFLYFGVVLSNSAGVLSVSLVFTPILAYFVYRKISLYNRKTYVHTIIIISALLLTALVITVVLYGFGELLVAVKPFFSDSSRTKLYEEALNLFAKYPLFGSGLGYVESDTVSALSISLYNFHSVFFHVLATMGIVGIVAYIFYYIARFKILMKNYNCFSLFATIAFLMFECYAFIDTAEFNAIPLMSTVTVFITIVELTNKKSNDEPLPLTINYYNKIIF